MTTMFDVLAENNFGDTRSGGLAGPMGLFIVVLLAVATVLLIRNMNARIRRLPDQFPDQRGPDQRGPDQHGPDQHGPDQHGPDQHDAEAGDPGPPVGRSGP